MREAVIVSVARTPIGKAYRGAFNDTDAPVLAAHCVTQALARAGVEGAEVEDLILGCAAQQGNQGYNVARLTVAAAGLPMSVAGMTIDRMCASGLMAVATAAKQIVQDRMPVVVAGGVESVSLVQNKHKNAFRAQTPAVIEHMPHMHMQMIETAEIVARRYGMSREAQDDYALQSQQRTAAAQAAGRFAEELAPLATVKTVEDKTTGEIRRERRVRARPLVAVEGHALTPHLSGRLVLHGLHRRERRKFLREPPGGLRSRGSLLTLQRVRVLRPARHAVATRNDLGGLDHLHVHVRHVLDHRGRLRAKGVLVLILHQAD